MYCVHSSITSKLQYTSSMHIRLITFSRDSIKKSIGSFRTINKFSHKHISVVNSPTYNIASNLQISNSINYVECLQESIKSTSLGLNEVAISIFLLGFSIRLLQVPTLKIIEFINYLYKTRINKRKEKIFNVNLDDHNKNPFFNKLFNYDLSIEASNLKLNKLEIEFIKKEIKLKQFLVTLYK